MPSNAWTPERFDLLAEYWGDRLVLEAAALNVHGQLDAGPLSAADLARELRLEPLAAKLFFDALVALGLLHRKGHQYSNTDVAERFLVPGSPDFRGHRLIVAHNDWNMWGRLTEGLRTGKRQRDKLIFKEEPVEARHLLLAIHRSARSRAADILDNNSIDLSGRRQMLDLGGGAGTYVVTFCRAYPELRATLVDRPIAAALARDLVFSAGLEDRITVLEYDVDEGDLSSTYDFIWISNVLHSRSEAANRSLLERLYSRVEDGGEIVIQDIIMDEDRTNPPRGAVFALHMLLSNGVGRCYTFSEVQGWLYSAGFKDVRRVQDHEHFTLVLGKR